MTITIDLPEQKSGTGAMSYPAHACDDERRRAYVLECIGTAASEMDTQTLCKMVVDLAEVLRTGVAPGKVQRLRPVP
jgi:hypothetical protein